MALKNTRLSYGSIHVFFHWILAVLIVAMVIGGLVAHDLPREHELKGTIIGVHKQLGVVVLLLMLLRLLWRWSNVRPDLERVPFPMRAGAFIVHSLLYVAVFGQALSGIAMSQVGGHPVAIGPVTLPTMFSWEGIGLLHDNFPSAKEAGRFLRNVHHLCSRALMGLIGLHVLAALYHHFIRSDDTLVRMWFGYRQG